MWRWWIVLVGLMMSGVAGGLTAVRAGGPSSAQWIAYVATNVAASAANSTHDTDDTLYLVSSDGSVQRRVVQMPTGGLQAVGWQGDALTYRRVVRSLTATSTDTRIVERYHPQTGRRGPSAMLPPLATQSQALTFNRLSVWESIPSPDGAWLLLVAYDVVPTAQPQTRGVFRVHPDGSELLRLSPLGLFNDAYDPAWSVDGQWVAFTAHIGNDDNLFKVRVDGSGLHQLTRNAAYDQTAHWSADSRWIVFTSDRTGYVQLYRVPADGSEHDVQAITDFQADVLPATVAVSPPVDLRWHGWALAVGALHTVIGLGLLLHPATSRYT